MKLKRKDHSKPLEHFYPNVWEPNGRELRDTVREALGSGFCSLDNITVLSDSLLSAMRGVQ